ncbi:MAG: hypothetical protein R3Y62_07605 [Eubacteriales bacterium]
MGFSELLGNEQLKSRLVQTFATDRPSHSYLICGAEGSGKKTLAKLLSAAFQCTAGGDVPCGHCGPCRKVMSGNHPDVITVDDPDKVQVSVDLIRGIQADAYIRPNEGKRKIFLIPRAGQMNGSAQNALLKLMEEPPAYGVFLLVAPTAEGLLPTIRSRCALLRLSPLADDVLRGEMTGRYPTAESEKLSATCGQSGGFLGQAITLMEQEHLYLPLVEDFATAYGKGDELGILSVFPPLEKKNRQEVMENLEQLREVVAEALAVSRGGISLYPQAKAIAARRSSQELFALCGHIQQAVEDCRGNVNVGNVVANLHAQI